jgi:hypothetical protein
MFIIQKNHNCDNPKNPPNCVFTHKLFINLDEIHSFKNIVDNEGTLTFFSLMSTKESKIQAWTQVWEGWGAIFMLRNIVMYKPLL